MKMLIESRQFRLVVSLVDLFHWPDDDIPVLLDGWRRVIELLGFDEAEIAALYDLYFDGTPIGQGDVHAFINNTQPENMMAFDLYRGLTDQLDVIAVVISVSRERVTQVKPLLRQVFDLASCQIHYEEGSLLQAFKEMTNVEGYPKVIEESGYRQQFLIKHG
ncbi:hypothetical protein NUH87_06255 [Pseudomonas batumici]|uniref:hypothetical protein n=1 Tax=Pseudomonas batumici TaxID=226910 RepID=UPI0030D1D7E9